MFERKSVHQLRRTPNGDLFSNIIKSTLVKYRIQLDDNEDLETVLEKVVNDAMDAEDVRGNDYIQIVIDSRNINEPVIINKHYCLRRDFNFSHLASHLGSVDQSNRKMLLSNEFDVRVYHVVTPEGNGIKRRHNGTIVKPSTLVNFQTRDIVDTGIDFD